MPSYTKLQEFETGQVIGRAQVGVLRDNDNYFNGLAYRWRPWMYSPSVLGLGPTSYTFWDGYHLLRSDATNLHYGFQVTGGVSDAATATMYYYKDDDTAYEVDDVTAAAGATQSVYDSLDLSDVTGISAGLHRVTFVLTYTLGDPGTGRVLRPPYTTYTGDEVFTVPPVIKDGAVGTAAHFNTWRNNDEYFQACSPNNPAFHMIKVRDPTDGPGELIWDGYVRHNTAAEQIAYRLKMSTDTNNNRLLIYYDYGGANQDYEVMDTAGSFVEGTWDLDTTTYTYTHGTFYRVAIYEDRDGGTPGADVWVDYVYCAPTSARLLNLMTDLTPEQWVYGNSALQTTRLELLSSWDYSIFKTMCYNANVGRMDWAVRNDSIIQAYNPTVTHRVKHIYDFLWYRGTGIAMAWGTDNSRSLPDTDSDTPVQVMDLRSLSNLAYGQHYTLTGNVDYACEATYSA